MTCLIMKIVNDLNEPLFVDSSVSQKLALALDIDKRSNDDFLGARNAQFYRNTIAGSLIGAFSIDSRYLHRSVES